MAYEFKLPDLGEGLTEGEIARWLVAEGQEVGEDDPLVEIQTDKTTVEIPSPAAGVVARILVEEGAGGPGGAGGAGGRRGRPARRDPDGQDDGGDPVAGRGRRRADPRRGGCGRPGRDGAR